jgi:hypothetical protein
MSDDADKGIFGVDATKIELTRNKDNQTIRIFGSQVDHVLRFGRVLEIAYVNGQVKAIDRKARRPLPSRYEVTDMLYDLQVNSEDCTNEEIADAILTFLETNHD